MLSVLPKEMQAIGDHEAILMSESEAEKNEGVSKTLKIEKAFPPRKSVVEEKQTLDIHVSVSQGFDFKNLQGLVNIHLHFLSK